jgi:hypothetical protein
VPDKLGKILLEYVGNSFTYCNRRSQYSLVSSHPFTVHSYFHPHFYLCVPKSLSPFLVNFSYHLLFSVYPELYLQTTVHYHHMRLRVSLTDIPLLFILCLLLAQW